MSHPARTPSPHPDDEVIASGRFIRLLRRDGWEFIDHPGLRGVVVIVAVTPDDRLLLVEQYRTPLHARVLELPAGIVGDKVGCEEEPFEHAAGRELEEETGWRAARFEFLSSGPASPGRTRYFYHFYRALDLARTGSGGGDETEDIRVHEIPLATLDAWLAAREAEGLLVDPKIYAGLHLIHRST